MSKKKILIISIFCIIIIIFVLIYNWPLVQHEEKSSRYIIHVNVLKKSEYIINVPIVINKDGTVSDLMNDLKVIDGTITSKRIVDTFYGLALDVKGNDNVTLIAKWEKSRDKNILYNPEIDFDENENFCFGQGLSIWGENNKQSDSLINRDIIATTYVYCWNLENSSTTIIIFFQREHMVVHEYCRGGGVSDWVETSHNYGWEKINIRRESGGTV